MLGLNAYKRVIDLQSAKPIKNYNFDKQIYNRAYFLKKYRDKKEFFNTYHNAEELLKEFFQAEIFAIFEGDNFIDIFTILDLEVGGQTIEIWRIKYY